MSEARIEASEAPDSPTPESEVEQRPVEAPEGEEDEGEGEGEGEDGEPRQRPTDWEKQAHDKAGLAAKERSRRRAAERELIETRARIERLEQTLTKPQQDELNDLIKGLRDDDDEPITDLNQIKRVLKTFMARQAAEDEAENQRNQTLTVTRQVADGMTAFEADFAADHPDYYKAAAFYREHRENELEELGYVGVRLTRKLAEDLYGLAGDVMKAGRDPAEVVYNLAKKRGFASGKDAAIGKLQKLQAGQTGAAPRGRGADNGLSWGEVAKLKGAARDAAFAKLRARELGRG
jgi:hypothetical protein